MSLVKKWWSGGSSSNGGGHAKHQNNLPSTVSGSSSSSASGRKRWPWGDKKTPAATEAACTSGASSSDSLDAVLREAGVQGLLAIVAGTWVTGTHSTGGGSGGWAHAVITSDGFVADAATGDRRLLHASPEGGLSLPSSAEASVSDAVAGDACSGDAHHAVAAVLAQSTRRELAWADGTVWRRADENDVVVPAAAPAASAAAAAAPLAAVQQPPPPDAGEAPVSLRVTCYDKHEVDGVYTRLVAAADGGTQDGEPAVHNGAPVYVSGAKRLYTGAAGYWMFSSALKMSKDLAVVSSAEPHRGQHPDRLRCWEYYQKPPRRASTTSSGSSSSSGSQPGDSPTPQWQPCTLLSIERLTPPHTAVPAAAATAAAAAPAVPAATLAAPTPSPPPPSAEETRLILDVFFATSGAEPPGARTQQKVIDDLAAYAAASGSPLPPFVSALCARAGVSDPLWRGAPLDVLRKNAQHYVFRCFFARYGRTELSTADRLFDDVCVAGRFTREQALRSVCQRFQEAHAAYGDWEGDYPVGVRHGFDPRRREKQDSLPLRLCRLVDILSKGSSSSLETNGRAKAEAKPSHPAASASAAAAAAAAAAAPAAPSAAATPAQAEPTRPLQRGGSAGSSFADVTATDPLHRTLMKNEKVARHQIAREQAGAVVSGILPKKAAICVGVMAGYQRRWVACLESMDDLAVDGTPPTDALQAAYVDLCTKLRSAIQAAEHASLLCSVPPSLVSLIHRTKLTLEASERRGVEIDALVAELAAHEARMAAVSADTRTLLSGVAACPDDEAAKERLAALHARLADMAETRRQLVRRIEEQAAGSPPQAYRAFQAVPDLPDLAAQDTPPHSPPPHSIVVTAAAATLLADNKEGCCGGEGQDKLRGRPPGRGSLRWRNGTGGGGGGGSSGQAVSATVSSASSSAASAATPLLSHATPPYSPTPRPAALSAAAVAAAAGPASPFAATLSPARSVCSVCSRPSNSSVCTPGTPPPDSP